jgi:hypothetical protein
MNVKATLAAIISFAMIAVIADSALAKEVPIKGNSKTQVKDKCDASGGTYWPTSAGGTYGCVNPDGSGIICGGVSAKDKKTCGTFRQVPPRIPTRDEIRIAEKTGMTEAAQKE